MEPTILDTLADSAIRLVAYAEEEMKAGRHLSASETLGAIERITRMVQGIQERDTDAINRSSGEDLQHFLITATPKDAPESFRD